MNKKLFVSPAPQITSSYSTLFLMVAMISSFVPICVFSAFNYGTRIVYHVLIGVGTSFLLDRVLSYAKDKEIDWLDISSVVTGFICALTLPVNAPLWMPALGSVIAIFIFKFCFGGLARNIFNPAAASRVVLSSIFSGLNLTLFTGSVLGENVASPLYYFAQGDYSSVTIRSMFFGSAPGAMGTTAIICILVCGIILMIFRCTDFIVVLSSIISFVAITWVGSGAIAIIPFLFTGSFLFATLFMITDPVTSPYTVWGRFIYGLLFGVIAGMFRITNVLGETSVFVAVLMVNLLSPLLDKVFKPRPLGIKGVR